MPERVLIASPVRQRAVILREFLESLERLDLTNLEVDLAFIDDRNDHDLLHRFAQGKRTVRILPSGILSGKPYVHPNPDDSCIDGNPDDPYIRDDRTHHWLENLIWKVAAYKDYLIHLALDEGYDYLFLVDSDLYLHPQTLRHLISLGKDIVSEVYWTRWEPQLIPLPQVWAGDQYRLYHSQRDETLSEEEAAKRSGEFLAMLTQPGTYKVGGLGACTLISLEALKLGVSFQEIYNLGFSGEDRHFCIRAAALGLELYADTHYPPLHLYRESDLEPLKEYKRRLNAGSIKDVPTADHVDRQSTVALIPPKITHNLQPYRQEPHQKSTLTLAMLVRNEAGRYLAKVLEHAVQYVDRAVILDDASEDDTVEICRDILKGIPLTLLSNPKPGFHNEVRLRKQLWQMTVNTQPDWILSLDADEIFEDKAPSVLRELLQRPGLFYFAFRLYDMWRENAYREDPYWNAHQKYRPFLVRYIPGFAYQWLETPQHCGRFPRNLTELQGENSDLRIKHLGWLKPVDRLTKYERYKKMDPGAVYGLAGQYASILDPRPALLPW